MFTYSSECSSFSEWRYKRVEKIFWKSQQGKIIRVSCASHATLVQWERDVGSCPLLFYYIVTHATCMPCIYTLHIVYMCSVCVRGIESGYVTHLNYTIYSILFRVSFSLRGNQVQVNIRKCCWCPQFSPPRDVRLSWSKRGDDALASLPHKMTMLTIIVIWNYGDV